MAGGKDIVLRSYAKINLSLTVTGRREDGYHNIRSLMQGIDLCDIVKLSICAENGTKYNLPHCTIGGVVVYLCTDVKTIPADMSNLALKGIAAVVNAAGENKLSGRSMIVTIEKKLPVAAGIAGGSGNAAVCMLGINSLMGNIFSLRELMELGVSVGADVPFSLLMNARRNDSALDGLRGLEEASDAAWIGGIGDIVEPVSPKKMHVILANPGIAVSTKDAYQAVDALSDGSEDPAGEHPMFVNDLEKYTLSSYKEAAELKAVMQSELGADTVMMSGSGPTMVAYYDDEAGAEAGFICMKRLCEEHPRWRAWITVTG